MGAVYRKEMRSFLTSMPGYIFAAFILAVIGIYYSYLNLNLASPKFENVLQSIEFVFLVFVPILTMRVFAEEKRQKTDQLLLTLPLKAESIVLGKYLALVTIYAIPMGIVCFYPAVLQTYGTVNMKVAYLSILAFFLLGCANMAIGMYCSSLTESPVISAVISFGVLLMLYLMNSIATMVSNTSRSSYIAFGVVLLLAAALLYGLTRDIRISAAAAVLSEGILSVIYLVKPVLFEGAFQKVLGIFYMNGRLTSFFDGILDLTGIIYYLSIIAVMVFLTVQTLVRRRWS